MATALRTVERLRLRARTQAAVQHLLPRIEDAFRCASLPDRGARLIVLRRLPLGRVSEHATSQALARALEDRFASLYEHMQHATHAGAEYADAVWFRDALDAHTLAARRVVARQPLTEWYWPLAIPILKQAGTANVRLRALAFSLAAHDEAPSALPAWIAALDAAGHGSRLRDALRPGDDSALSRTARVDLGELIARRYRSDQTVDRRVAATDMRHAATTLPDAADHRLSRRSATDPHRPAIEDPQQFAPATAIGTAPAFGTAPASAVSLVPPAAVTAGPSVPDGARTEEPPGSDTAGIRTNATTSPARDTTSDRHVPPDRSRRDATPARHVQRHAGVPHLPRSAGVPHPPNCAGEPDDTTRTNIHSATADSCVAIASAAGGLLFLVPVLARLGFAQWWTNAAPAAHTTARECVGQLFHTLLARLAIAEDDPAWQLACGSDASMRAAQHAQLIEDIRAHEARTLATSRHNRRPPPQLGNAALSSAWLQACRRYARLRAHIGLATLVRRPARIALTPTHADVWFELNRVDLRIRRAGLDIDPGWVPWLGRVVTFHYEARAWI